MDHIEENKKYWDKHFSTADMDYPDEDVVRFLARCKKLYPNGHMLDWGCGPGRHTLAALRFGFHVTAVDQVERCVEMTRVKISREHLEERAILAVSGLTNVNDVEMVDASSMDMILAWGTAFYNRTDGILRQFDSMSRMLKRGGRAFCDFRTDRDSHLSEARSGDLVELSHFDDGTTGRMTLLSESDLRSLISRSDLTIETLELFEFTTDNMAKRNSWWHVVLVKE